MEENFKLEIISPEKIIYSQDTRMVTLPSYEGDMSILKNHISIITFLRPGLIEIEKNEKFYVEDGTVEFSDNNLLILSTTVQRLKDLKTERVNQMLADSEKKLSENQVSDKQKYILNYKIETLKQINQ